MAGANRPDWQGTPTARKAIGDFVFVQHVYPSRSRGPRHSHSWLHFALVQRGYYVRTVSSRVQQFRPGQLSLLATEETHSDEYAPGTKCLHLVIPAAFETKLTRDLPARRIIDSGKFSPFLSACAGTLHSEFVRPDNCSPKVIEAILLDLVSREIGIRDERSRLRPAWIRTVLNCLDDTFDQPPSLREIADEVGVHPVYLCRAFFDHLGFTFGQYIRHLRVLRGWQLLVTGHDGKMSEIAAEAGFADESHFSRTFKQAYGAPPARYRRLMRI
jgi:AraC family transcriptional regulator